jgi:ureidoacrylate peracid hydrolase
MHDLTIDPWFIERAKKARGGRINAYETLDPCKTALIVVDMQDYFCADGMPACAPVARQIVPNINRLAETVRSTGGLVAWIQTEAPADPNDWPNRKEATSVDGWERRRSLLARTGEGFPIFDACDVKSEDHVALKTRYSAFIPHPSELDSLLREHSIDTLLITGVATSTCCESTARDGSMWGYRTIMISDGNADQTDTLHNHTLGKFLVTFGDVQSTDDTIKKLIDGSGRAAAE